MAKSKFKQCVDDKEKTVKVRKGGKYKTKREAAAAVCASIGYKKYGKKGMQKLAAAGRKKAKKARAKEGLVVDDRTRSQAIHYADDLTHMSLEDRRKFIAELTTDAIVHAGIRKATDDLARFVHGLLTDPVKARKALHDIKETGFFERNASTKALKSVMSYGWKLASREDCADDIGAVALDFVSACFSVPEARS